MLSSKTLTPRSLVAIDVCLYVVEYLLGIQIKMSHALQEIPEENEKLGVSVEEMKSKGSKRGNEKLGVRKGSEKIWQSTDLTAVRSHQSADVKQEAHHKGEQHSKHPLVYPLLLKIEKLMNSLTSTR